jgi:hypothetical protein
LALAVLSIAARSPPAKFQSIVVGPLPEEQLGLFVQHVAVDCRSAVFGLAFDAKKVVELRGIKINRPRRAGPGRRFQGSLEPRNTGGR